MIKKIIKKRFEIALGLTFLLALVLRFANYANRWGLASDQARDVIVSTYALSNHLIPIIGPFSSAGPFVYGPQWYWIISLFISLYPGAVITPWLIQSLLYVFTVYVMYLVGKEIINKNFGLLLSFLTAVSIQEVTQSTNLVQPTFIGILSVIIVYFFIRYIKYFKIIDACGFGFMLGLIVNIHFQTVGLLMLLPISIFLSRKSKKHLFYLIIAFFIPFIPLLIFDLRTNFFESKNIIDYYLYGQNKIYFSNRWLAYVGVFWPKVWSNVIGGQVFWGYFIILILSVFSVIEILKRKIIKEILILIIAFIFPFVLLRYYKGQIVDTYITFLHPFILIFTAWVFYKIFNFNKAVFTALFVLMIFTTMQVNLNEITIATNNTSREAIQWKNELERKFPNDKFAIYDYEYQHSHKGLPLVMYLNADGKISDNGMKIGIASNNKKLNFLYHSVITNKDNLKAYNINSSSSADLLGAKWVFINPSAVYKSIEYWYWNKNK